VQVGDLVKCTHENYPGYGIVMRPGVWNHWIKFAQGDLRWVSGEYLEVIDASR